MSDANGSSDCFVWAYVEGCERLGKSTSVIPKSLNPVWNTTLSLPCPKSAVGKEKLVLEVYDHDWNGKDFLGYATVDVSGLALGQVRDEKLDLQWREGVKLKYSTGRSSSRGLGTLFVRVGAGETKAPPLEFLKATSMRPAREMTKVPYRLHLPLSAFNLPGALSFFFCPRWRCLL